MFGSEVPGFGPEYEPRGAVAPQFQVGDSGESSGGLADRLELQAPSPRRSLPLLQLLRGEKDPASRIRGSHRAEDMPTSGRSQAESVTPL